MKQSLLNMKAAMIATLLAMLAIPAANAWTAQQLVDYCNGNATELIGSYGNQNSLATNSRPVQLAMLTNGNFRVKNFMGYFSVDFSVSGNTVTAVSIDTKTWPTTSGSAVNVGSMSNVRWINLARVIRVDAPSATQNGILYYGLHADRKVAANGNCWNYLTVSAVKNQATNYSDRILAASGWGQGTNVTRSINVMKQLRTTWQGTIVEDDLGNPHIIFGGYENFQNSNSIKIDYLNASGTVLGYDMCDTYVLTLYKSNGVATDNQNPAGYPIGFYNIADDENYNFAIANFANSGVNYENFNVNNSQEDDDCPYFEWDVIRGKITGNDVEIPQQPFFALLSGQMNAYNNESVLVNNNYYTCGMDANNKPLADRSIRGRIKGGSAVPYHVGNTSWHFSQFGGDLHTYKGGQILELDPFAAVNKAATMMAGSVYKNTSITLSDPIECTFHCQTFALSDFTHDPSKHFIMEDGVKKYYINIGSVTLADCINTDHVKNIELMVVDNLHLSTSTIDLSQARRVAYLSCPQPGEDSEEYNKKFFPTMITNPTTGKVEMLRDYTFFLRVNYKDDFAAAPGVRMAATLEPSHHNMTAKNIDEVVTSVDGIETMGDVMMKATQRGVIVTAPYDCDVTVYNMAGIAVANGTANTEIAVNANGVFIVKAAGKAFKLIR